MSLVVLGMNHRSAELALLERVAVPVDELPKALRSLAALDHVLEAAILSTCNRVEVYAHLSRFHDGMHELTGWFASRADLPAEAVAAAQYGYHDEEAAQHLFAVAAGADSMVVGERQITLQVKHATKLAAAEGTSGRVLRRLFEHALFTARRVRSETDIERGASSLVDVGLAIATDRLGGSLTGRTVLVLGAGKLGGLAGARLAASGVARVLVRNRSEDRAHRLAQRVGAETIAAGGLPDAVRDADLVVCCAGASAPLLDTELVEAASRARRGRPLVLLDLALPRNVEPGGAAVPGVELIDLDDVRVVADARATGTVLEQARSIVSAEAARYRSWTAEVQVDPTIRALRGRAEEVRRGELERLSSRLAGLDERQREAVEAVTRGILNTLLHEPTVKLKALADRGGAEQHANALRELFDLDE